MAAPGGPSIQPVEPFTPEDASVTGWYRADDLTGGDGSAVATWTDRSGNGHHLTQAVGASQPTLKTSIYNGHSVVRFDGTDDFLSASNFLNGETGSVVAVVKLDAVNADYTFLASSDTGSTNRYVRTGFLGSLTDEIFLEQVNADTADKVRGSTDLLASEFKVVAFHSDGSNYRMRVDNASETLTIMSGGGGTTPSVAAVSTGKTSSTSAGLQVTFGTDGPSGIAAGDLLVFFVGASGNNTTAPAFNVPSGWNVAEDEVDAQGARVGATAFWKISDGTETAVVATLSAGTSVSRGLTGIVVRIIDHDTSSPISVTATTAVDTSTATVDLAGVTTPDDNSLVLYYVNNRANEGVTWSFASGSEIFDFNTDPGTGNTAACATVTQVVAGATGTIVATETGSTGAFAAVGITIAIKPSGGETALPGDWMADTTGRDNVTVGALVNSGGASVFLDGDIAELLVFDTVLEPVVEGEVYDYLIDFYAPVAPPEPSTGFPDETNTGIPAGTELTPSGNITVTTNNTIIDAMDVTGRITVNAGVTGVIIKRCRIIGNNLYEMRCNTGSDVTIQDCYIEGTTSGVSGTLAGVSGRFTAERCHIVGGVDGVKLANACIIRDSYIHDLIDDGNTTHNDGMQLAGGANVEIDHCTIIVKKTQNACIILKTDSTGIDTVTVNNCFLSGGGYSFRCTNQGAGGAPTNVSVTNCVIERDSYQFGYKITTGATVTWTGNTFSDNGDPAP